VPDLAAAVGSALADGIAPEGVRLLVAWRRVLLDTPVPAALLAQLAPALAATPDEALASRGHTVAARLALNAGQSDAARDHAERGIALARRATAATRDGDELLARALHGLASTLWRTLRRADRTEACLDEAQAHADRCGDPGLQASLLALRGFVTNVARRDLAQAEALHGAALALWERAGDGVAANNGRYNLAVCAMRARRFDEALQRLQDVAEHARAQHDWRLLSQVSNVVGEARSGRRQWREAAAAYRHSLELAWNLLASQPLAYALWNLPHALVRLREADRAAQLGAAAARYWTAHVGPLDASDLRQLELLRRQAATLVGTATVRAAWRAGESMGTDDAVALALRD
jgi:tetratricopeptide (TPR) repeat protein